MFRYEPVPIKDVKLSDSFLSRWVSLNRETVIPYSIQRCDETGRIDAFKLDWKPGMPKEPHRFWDSDFAKVLEGAYLDLMAHPDPEREAQLDKYVDLIISAQQPDGYLNTHFTVVEPEKRWWNLRVGHELYCAGHLMEAAVAHFQATGNRKFLDCLCRYADYIGTVFGPGKGQLKGYPGHEEIELALCKLADASGNRKYAQLAKFFIDQRGQQPNYFDEEARIHHEAPIDPRNLQAHIPVREQKDATGHAVRAMYLSCGMAEMAVRFDDEELLACCKRMFESVTKRNMYITGGVGSSEKGESFSADYHLPNAYAYAESCASIGLALFAMRMGNITGEAGYFDVMERAIFNGILSGLALSGTEFFYENKLEVNQAVEGPVGHHRLTRQPWFSTSCCPTNFCRFLPQLQQMAYSYSADTLCVNMPLNAHLDIPVSGGRLKGTVTGDYPLDNCIRLHIEEAPENSVKLRIRIPYWADNAVVHFNRKVICRHATGIYATEMVLHSGDVLEINHETHLRVNYADPRVSDAAGKVALSYGPFVLALESIDNATADMSALVIDTGRPIIRTTVKGLPKGTPAFKGHGFVERSAEPGELYSTKPPKRKPCTFVAIPYCLWQNRGVSNMAVWFRKAASPARH